MAMLALEDFAASLTLGEWVKMFGVREDASIRKIVPFNPWIGQRRLLHWLNGRKHSWIPKARQLGISELAGERLVIGSVQLPGAQFAVISKVAGDADYFLEERVVPKILGLPYYKGIIWPTIKSSSKRELVLSNGSSIISLPATGASGASRTLNGYVLDEMGGIDSNSQADASEIHKNIKPTIEKSGGWGMYIGTSEPGSYFNSQIRKMWLGEIPKDYFFLSWMTDPNRNAEWEAAERQTLKTEADFYNQYPATIEQFFATREGRVFPSFDHMVGGKHVHQFELNYNDQYITAYDHGFRHYAANLHSFYNPYNDMLFVFDEQFWKETPVDTIASDVNRYTAGIPRVPEIQLADTQIFNEDGRIPPAAIFRKYGVHFKKAYKADEAGSRDLLQTRFANRKIVIHPRCKNTIDQLMGYVWKPNNTGKETPVDRNDEAPDCLRYICAHLSPKVMKQAPGPEHYSGYQRFRGDEGIVRKERESTEHLRNNWQGM